MTNTENRLICTSIEYLLMNLSLHLTNRVLLTLVAFDDKQTVDDVCDSARTPLTKNFLLFRLAFEHITRERIVRDERRSLGKSLLADGKDVMIPLMEGTNLYVQSNGNNHAQRKLYRLHDNKPLIKAMVICTRNRCIMFAMGRYLVDFHNDDTNIPNH